MVLVNLCKTIFETETEICTKHKNRTQKHTNTSHITHTRTSIHAFHKQLRQIGKVFISYFSLAFNQVE